MSQSLTLESHIANPRGVAGDGDVFIPACLPGGPIPPIELAGVERAGKTFVFGIGIFWASMIQSASLHGLPCIRPRNRITPQAQETELASGTVAGRQIGAAGLYAFAAGASLAAAVPEGARGPGHHRAEKFAYHVLLSAGSRNTAHPLALQSTRVPGGE